MKLLSLVLLLSTLSSLILTEVMEDLGQWKLNCSEFFIQNPENQTDVITPSVFTGDQYRMICQRYNNKYRFATLYDTQRRIPVYSAYTYLEKKCTKRSKWRIEPQLENITEYKNKKEMIISPTNRETVRKLTHQAVSLDYINSSYTRGHVFPCSFATDQDQAKSTFTLTNIAPQTSDSNGQWESKVEIPMRELIKNKCRLDQNHQAYIVTGVVPGNQWIAITRDQNFTGGINIPSHYWSAFCCTQNNTNIRISKAYIAKLENFTHHETSISNLTAQLTELYAQDFSVFPGSKCENIEPDYDVKTENPITGVYPVLSTHAAPALPTSHSTPTELPTDTQSTEMNIDPNTDYMNYFT